MIEKKNMLGIWATDASEKEVLEYITKNLLKDEKKYLIATLNPEILVLANKNPKYKEILNHASLGLVDGIGVKLAGMFLGRPFRQRITGADLVKNLCFYVAEKPITVGFLGGRGGVAEKTAECLRKMYPGLKVGFVGEEWPSDKISSLSGPVGLHPRPTSSLTSFGSGARRGSPAPATRSDSRITPQFPKTDILFVAFGAPKQEIWIHENLDKIPVKVAIGVGGAFDYIGGKVPRAPLLVQRLGFEWLFRLIDQPWRIKRQLALIEFIWLVLREKLDKK